MKILINIMKSVAELFTKSLKFGERATKEVILNKRPDETDPKTNYETTQKIRKEKEIQSMKAELAQRRRNSNNKNKHYEKNK